MGIYDGSAFAAYEDVVVVTVNYRTNGISTRCQSDSSDADMA
jgi:hypothetical protein